jgi:hypothetical protein
MVRFRPTWVRAGYQRKSSTSGGDEIVGFCSSIWKTMLSRGAAGHQRHAGEDLQYFRPQITRFSGRPSGINMRAHASIVSPRGEIRV